MFKQVYMILTVSYFKHSQCEYLINYIIISFLVLQNSILELYMKNFLKFQVQ